MPAVHSDWVVSRLLLLFLNCGNDVDHALPVGGNAHLRPAVEMKQPHGASLVFLPSETHRVSTARCAK